MQLTQQETNKVKERDEQHTVELREWRGEIAKRKQVQLLATPLFPSPDTSHFCRSLKKNSVLVGKSKNNSIPLIAPFPSSCVRPCLSLGARGRETGL